MNLTWCLTTRRAFRLRAPTSADERLRAAVSTRKLGAVDKWAECWIGSTKSSALSFMSRGCITLLLELGSSVHTHTNTCKMDQIVTHTSLLSAVKKR